MGKVKTRNGASAELITANKFTEQGFRIYFPLQGNNKEDDLTVVSNVKYSTGFRAK